VHNCRAAYDLYNGFLRLDRPAQTTMIFYAKGTTVIGISVERILKVFRRRITCSTIIRRLAMRLVFITAAVVIWEMPRFVGGTDNVTCRMSQSDWIKNPLSAIISSYWSSPSKKPLERVTWVSEWRPGYAGETKVIAEFGATAMRNFRVLWCL